MDDERRKVLSETCMNIVSKINELKLPKKDICQCLCIILGASYAETVATFDKDRKKIGLKLMFDTIEETALRYDEATK